MKKLTPAQKRAKREYVVGYAGDDQDVVYGPDFNGNTMYCHKMTKRAANRRLDSLGSEDALAHITVRPFQIGAKP